MIPKTFIRKYGENLSSPTLLKLPKDAKWKVELTYHNGEVWLQKRVEKATLSKFIPPGKSNTQQIHSTLTITKPHHCGMSAK